MAKHEGYVPLDITGKEGESLLTRLRSEAFEEAGGIGAWEKEIGRETEQIETLLEQEHSDRALALCGALVSENSLDRLLVSWVPGYVNSKTRSMSFDSRLELARALRLVPMHLLDSMKPVNKIRNRFAHDLSLSKFTSESLSMEFRGVAEHLSKICGAQDLERRMAFEYLVILTAAAIRLYARQLEVVADYVRNPVNLDTMLGLPTDDTDG